MSSNEAQAVLDAFSYRCPLCDGPMSYSRRFPDHANSTRRDLDVFVCESRSHMFYRHELERH